MTMPSERTRAVLQTEEFLKDLCDSSKTPRVPAEIRNQARQLLRHYPNKMHLDLVEQAWNSKNPLLKAISQCPFSTEA